MVGKLHRLRTTAFWLAPIILMLTLALISVPAVAQDASPEASPDATPVAAADACTTIFAIGGGGDGCVAVIHALADVPAADVYVDGELLPSLTNLPFPFKTPFLPLAEGDHTVRVTATGAPDVDVVPETSLSVEAGTAYEVAALGTAAAGEFLVQEVDLSPTGSDYRVRIVNAVADSEAMDLVANGSEDVVTGLAALETSDYLMRAGEDAFELAGYAAGERATPLVTLSGYPFASSTATTLYVVGTLADPTTLTIIGVTAPVLEGEPEGTPEASPEA